MSDQAIQPIPHQQATIRRSRRLVDNMAISSVAAIAIDRDVRKKHQATEDRMADEIEEHIGKLAGSSPSPLAESLALTVALCEHDVRIRQTQDGPLKNNHDRQKNLDRSMRRYLSACKMLAIVQRLNLPSIQVNIAEQQVVANG